MKFTGAIVILATSMAAAQEKPAEPPALKGPTVSTESQKPTLVERDFSGRLKRLEVPPEEAALRFITLDDAARARVDTIIAERAAILDKAVIDNLDLIVQIHNAGQSGDKKEAMRLLVEFAQKLEALKSRGKLVDEVSHVLPASDRERYTALVKDYREAGVRDWIDQAKSKGEELSMAQAAGREFALAMGQEIKRSYDRQITSKAADYEQLLATLSLKPEQETKVRNAVTDYVQATKGKPTPEQKRDLFWKIYKELDREQRRLLVDRYRSSK